MDAAETLKKIEQSISNLDIDSCTKACQEALKDGIAPMDIISKGMARGMEIVGEKYEKNEYFLSELIMAGEVMQEGMKIVKPHVKQEQAKTTRKVVLGTVSGDMHDIGKNIVAMLLAAAGFQVIDLGVDVPAESFVEAVQNNAAGLVGMSALLSVTVPEMDNTINELEKRGLRKGLKVIIGGAAVTTEYGEKIGADYAARDAVEGVNKCKLWAK
jgi:5-methyltetrahydrofolate--homocysteine methyltransferase